GQQFTHQLQSFLCQYGGDYPNAGDVSTRPVEAGHKAEFDWISAGDEDDGDRRCCGLGSKYCRWSERPDHRHLALHEISRHRRQWTITIRYPAVFDPHVLTFDIAHFGKTAPEYGIEMHGVGLRQAAEISDYRHLRLLRPRRQRPRCRRAAQECDEVAPSHAKLPVEDKAYQRAALCVTAKLAARWQRWVNRFGPNI